MIHVASASMAFGDHALFHNLDLHVGKGQLVGLVGESGCGKTSLLRAILGFIPLAAGSIAVSGLPLDAHHVGEIRRRTAYVPQELQPLAETGADLVALTHGLEANRRGENRPPFNHPPFTHKPFNHPPYNKKGILCKVCTNDTTATSEPLSSSLLKSLGLDNSLLNLSAAKLSGGQRQRLLLAAALALPKPLLLLDEPSSALDEESTQRVGLTLLHACHEEHRTALIVSHDPVLLGFCDKTIALS